MFSLQSLLRPRMLVGGGIAGVFSVTTIMVFKLLGWSILLAVLLIITIALIAMVIILVRQLQSARRAEEIEKTISNQADRDIERSSPGMQAEMQTMKAELLAALEALKNSKMGRRGKGALSELPWYMVVGPRDAGKSTLIKRSGLHFPLKDEGQNPRSVRGVGGTRSLEWWLTEEAVVLDLAGRAVGATAQFEDNDDWFAFLDVLRKQRKDKPLNGVIVTVGCDVLAESEAAKVDKLALAVRERIHELIERLGVVFPVYVAFTKIDRLAGFAEFFGDFDANTRVQPWGATIAPERARDEDPTAIFETEFEHLRGALSDRRMARLADVPDPVQRARAFAFPIQMERLRPSMRRFVKLLFQPDPAQETALFRGFYFTSAVQEGASIDRVLQPAAESLGVAAAEAAPPLLPPEGAYFVQDLLGRVVFGDASLAAVSTREQTARARARIFMFAMLGVALLAIAITFITLAFINGGLVHDTRRAAADAAQSITAQSDLMSGITTLETLRSRTEKVDGLVTRKPFWRGLGAYSGDRLRDPALQLYSEKLLESVVAPGFNRMESELTRITDANQGTFYDYYMLFRAWRLLTTPAQIKPDDAPVLAREMGRVLASRLELATPEDRARFPKLVQAQMAFICSHPDYLVKLAPAYYRLGNADLVRRAAERVRNTWDSSQFYRAMIDDAAPATKEATLASLIGQPGFLAGGGRVAGPWTLDGWLKQIKPRIDEWQALMQRDWVIADAFQGRPPDLVKDLRTSYARDYTKQWVDLMNSIGAQEARDPGAVAELIKLAAQDDSPILRLLRAVGQQTSLGVDDASDVGAVQRDFAIVQQFFGPEGLAGTAHKGLSLFQRKPSRLDAGAPMSDRYQDELKNALTEVTKLVQNNEPMGAMRKLADPGSATSAANGWIGGIGSPYTGDAARATVRFLQLPISAVIGGSHTTTLTDLNNRWSLLVYGPFQKTLANKYPIADQGQDLSAYDFTEFFRPGGTFWSFYDSYLKDYVHEDGSPMTEGQNVPLTPAFLDCLRKAYVIRQGFFSAKPAEASLKFAVRTNTPEMEGPHLNVRRISFDLGGDMAAYIMGIRDWKELEWPGSDPNAGAALRLDTSGGPAADNLSEPGLWGLFKLLDRAQFAGAESATPAASWRVSAGPTTLRVVYEFQPVSTNHPFKPRFLRFSPPPSLQ